MYDKEIAAGKTKEQAKAAIAKQKAVYNEFGAWATAKGYDYIHWSSDDYWIMLNRTKTIVKE